MSAFPGSSRLVKDGIVLVDLESSAVLRIIALQYNPDTLTRSLQVQAIGGVRGEPSPFGSSEPSVETIKLDAEIDATDQQELGDPTTAEAGIPWGKRNPIPHPERLEHADLR